MFGGKNMKTPLTIEIESSLYQYCIEQGGLVVEEVTMPDDLICIGIEKVQQYLEKRSVHQSI